MDVAVGQHQRCQPGRVVGGKNLRDGAAGIVGDQIDLFDAETVQHLGDHVRLRRERDILRGSDFGVAETHQIDGDAAPPVFYAVDDMTPVIAVDGHAVDKERDRSLSLLEMGDASGFDLGKTAAAVKICDVHGQNASVVAEAI